MLPTQHHNQPQLQTKGGLTAPDKEANGVIDGIELTTLQIQPILTPDLLKEIPMPLMLKKVMEDQPKVNTQPTSPVTSLSVLRDKATHLLVSKTTMIHPAVIGLFSSPSQPFTTPSRSSVRPSSNLPAQS